MTFEEWWKEFNSCCPLNITDKEIAKWAWGYQQKHIDELNECLEQALSDLKYTEKQWDHQQAEVDRLRGYIECGMSADAKMVADVHLRSDEIQEAAFDEGVKWTLKQDANTLNKLQLTLEEE